MSTIDLCLNSICQQRRKQLLFNVPPIRYNPVSPYVQFPQYTQSDYDMRRKAEILKYNANKTNTKTNNFTKAEKWNQLVNGKNQSNSYPYIVSTGYYDNKKNYISANIINKYTTVNICNPDLIPTPTSSSGIPGKVIYLINDETVPLYNYSTKFNSYGITTTETTDNYNYIKYDDVFILNQNYNTLFSLEILNNNDENTQSFSFKTPMSIYFTNDVLGNVYNGNIIYDISARNLNVNIDDIQVKVYYNNETVNIINANVYYANSYNTITYDLSYNSTNKYSSYSGEIYVGMLEVSNIYLYTEPGYVYDIKLYCKLSNSTTTLTGTTNETYNSIFGDLTTGIKFNTTLTSIINSNCSITSSSNNNYTDFSLLGY